MTRSTTYPPYILNDRPLRRAFWGKPITCVFCVCFKIMNVACNWDMFAQSDEKCLLQFLSFQNSFPPFPHKIKIFLLQYMYVNYMLSAIYNNTNKFNIQEKIISTPILKLIIKLRSMTCLNTSVHNNSPLSGDLVLYCTCHIHISLYDHVGHLLNIFHHFLP